MKCVSFVSSCSTGWLKYDNDEKKCVKYFETYEGFNESKEYCVKLNASLVVVDTPKKLNFLREYLVGAQVEKDVWVNAARENHFESMRWPNGSQVDGEMWNKNEPTQNCGEMRKPYKKLNTYFCSNLQQLICEMSII